MSFAWEVSLALPTQVTTVVGVTFSDSPYASETLQEFGRPRQSLPEIGGSNGVVRRAGGPISTPGFGRSTRSEPSGPAVHEWDKRGRKEVGAIRPLRSHWAPHSPKREGEGEHRHLFRRCRGK